MEYNPTLFLAHQMRFRMRANFYRLCAALAVVGLLSACVTINIYFPAAAAEKVADRILDDIWQTDAPAGEVKK
jgi:tricorn protease-like protein